MIYFYRTLYAIIRILVVTFKIFWPASFKHWIQRRQIDLEALVPLSSKSIWFHASSGEVEYVKNIITEIKLNQPQQKIVLTYSSPSIEKLLHNIKDHLDLIIPLPWDQPQATQKLLEIINPKTLVFAKTDFWPELLFQARKSQVRCGVVSFALNLKHAPTFAQKWGLQNMQFIFVSDEVTKERLKKVGLDSVVAADTRYDQVFFRLNLPSRFNFSFLKPVMTFGSTWPEDDKILLKALPGLLEMGLQIVWCPHDVSSASINILKEKLKGQNFSVFSDLMGSAPISSDLLIIDQVGLLADIYRLSEMAFIGGSFKDKVHSVMEALCSGNIVFFGPCFQNNSEAIEFSGLNLAFSFTTAEQLLQKVHSLSQKSRFEMQEILRSLTSRKKGSSKKIAEYLLT